MLRPAPAVRRPPPARRREPGRRREPPAPSGTLELLVRRPGRARAPRRRRRARFPTTQDSGDSFVDRRRGLARLGARRRRPARRRSRTSCGSRRRRRSLGAASAAALRKPPFAALDVTLARRDPRRSPERSDRARDRLVARRGRDRRARARAARASRSRRSGSCATRATRLFDLESQGAGPRALRACVRWRALGLAVLGVRRRRRARHRPGRRHRAPARASTPRSPCPIRRSSASRRGSRSAAPPALLALLAAALVEASPARRLPARRRRARRHRGAVGRVTAPSHSSCATSSASIADSATGAVALQGMTLSVARGERCVVLGPSGSGKSTLLQIAAGFDRPSAGVARTLGVDVVRLARGARRAFRSRQPRLPRSALRARALARAHLRRERRAAARPRAASPPRERRRRALALLDGMGLADRADDPPSELSGGEQQRVAACAALAHAPALLLADEPAGELDAAHRAHRLRAARRARRRQRHDARRRQPRRGGDRARRPRRARARRAHQRRDAARRSPRLVVGRGGWVRLPGERARRGPHRRPRRAGAPSAGEVDALRRRRGEPAAPLRRRARPARRARGRLRAARDRQALRRGRRAHRVLDGFDASFARGRLVAVEGRSGSGKTTLLHLIAGLERPDAGSVVVAGADLAGLDREAARRAPPRPRRLGRAGARASSRSRRRSRTSLLALEIHARRPRAPSTSPTRAPGSSASGWPTASTAPPTASRPASASASRSPARSPAAPTSLLLDEPTARLDQESAALVAGPARHAPRGSRTRP